MSRIAGMAPDGPRAVGPYSHYVIANGFVYVSGQVPIDPATGTMDRGPISAQTRRALDNLRLILEAAGSSLAQVVRCGVFLTDMANFAELNQVYAEYFPDAPPVRTAVAVSALPGGAAVEIEAVAVLD